MAILLVAATTLEIQPLIDDNPGVDILITGLGAVETCFRLHEKLSEQKYEFVIQAGVAGVFENKIPLAEVVGISDDCFGDLGFERSGDFIPLHKTAFADAGKFPFTNGKLINNSSIKAPGLKIVNAVTVNKVSDSKEQINQLQHHFDPAVESMEGASFHYVCLMKNIAYLQIRAVSNHVGERNKDMWKLKEAIINLNQFLASYISNFNAGKNIPE